MSGSGCWSPSRRGFGIRTLLMPKMIEVCCVLNGNWPTGRDDRLGDEYVRRLFGMLDVHKPKDINWRFTCFTDRDYGRALPKGLWTWFSKLWIFSPEAFPLNSKVLYFDLDTVIVANWGPLIREEPMVALGDVLPGTNGRVPVPASGLMTMLTTPDTQRIWTEFIPHIGRRPPYEHHLPTVPRMVRTDEQWLYPYLKDKWQPWEKLIPTRLASYKNKIMRESRFLRQAKGDEPVDWGDIIAVYGHGTPRPHTWPAVWNPWKTNSIFPSLK